MVVAAAQSAPSASDGYMRQLSAKNALQVATRPLKVKTRVNFVPMGNTKQKMARRAVPCRHLDTTGHL